MSIDIVEHKSINNLDIILPLLEFDDPFDCYFVMVLHRNKDGTKKIGGNNKDRIIKSFLVMNKEYLVDKFDDMIKLANIFGARVVINLNRRNLKSVTLGVIKELISMVESDSFFSLYGVIDSVLGKKSSEKKKKFIVDIDSNDLNSVDEICSFINSLEPLDVTNKIIAKIPSKNGIHIITSPFNTQKFHAKFPNIDIHKNNPTNLYIP